MPGTEPVPREIEWTCHPARRRPLAALAASLVLAALVWGVWAAAGDPILAAAAAVVLLLSLSPFYLPTRYRMTEDTITIRTVFGQKRKPWDLYRRRQVDRHGVLLSPFDRPSRLDRFHGLNLRFDAEDRARVLDFVRARLEEA